jgi:hypothetical protein
MKTKCLITSLALSASLTALADETTGTKTTSPASGTNALTYGSPAPATASESGRFGAGFVFGEPTGFNAKYWLNNTMALDGQFGISLRDDDNYYLNADILWHNYDLIPVSHGRAAAYLGVGPSIEFRDEEEDNRFGVRVPIGVSYQFDDKPLDVFVEFAPILDFSPDVEGDFNIGIGLRYWF